MSSPDTNNDKKYELILSREFVVDVFKTFQPRTMGELTRAVGCTVEIDVWVNNGELLVKNKIAAVDEVIISQDDVIDFLMTHYINPYDAWRIVKNIKTVKDYWKMTEC